jgi:hypothetical protein
MLAHSGGAPNLGKADDLMQFVQGSAAKPTGHTTFININSSKLASLGCCSAVDMPPVNIGAKKCFKFVCNKCMLYDCTDAPAAAVVKKRCRRSDPVALRAAAVKRKKTELRHSIFKALVAAELLSVAHADTLRDLAND